MIRRKRYRPACSCPGNSGIITAPPAPKLIPKGRYGISIWTQVLLDKFLFFRANHRLIADLATHGITLPPGTLAGGLERIAPMLEPIVKQWFLTPFLLTPFLRPRGLPPHGRSPEPQLPSPSTWLPKITVGILPF